MANKKLLSTSKLIESVSLRCSLPLTQNTFQEKDFLYFINEEIDMGVVPHILMYHEDYFLFTETIPLEYGVNRYVIPNRSVGTKLRDVSYLDGSNTYEMTRRSVEDMSDDASNNHTNLRSFYIEGDEIVIQNKTGVGSLRVSYYIRPNSIVSEDDICNVLSINRNNGTVTVDKYPEKFLNATTFDITSSKSSFRLIGKEVTPSGIASSSNLLFTFGTSRLVNYTLPTFASIVDGSYIEVIDNSFGNNSKYVFWFDRTGSAIAPVIPSASLYEVDVISALSNTDVISALSSVFNLAFSDSRLLLLPVSSSVFSIQSGGPGISVGNNFTVSSTLTLVETVLQAGEVTIPTRLNIDDVISLPEETSIPQIPIELHSMLAQRVAMRCLESLGDTAGLQAAAAKLADMEAKTGSLIDNRVESSPLKVVSRHTRLRNNSNNYRGK